MDLVAIVTSTWASENAVTFATRTDVASSHSIKLRVMIRACTGAGILRGIWFFHALLTWHGADGALIPVCVPRAYDVSEMFQQLDFVFSL